MSTSPLTIVAITTAVAGKEKALRAAQEKLVAETVKEPGCLRYELIPAFIVFNRWRPGLGWGPCRDQGHFQGHRARVTVIEGWY
jgi:hypothetical protein